jgi:hypothetical protein
MNLLEWLCEQTGMDQIDSDHRLTSRLRLSDKVDGALATLPVIFVVGHGMGRANGGQVSLT